MYDYVVVGGGTAGPVIAARLSENPGTSVLLLEAGPENSHEASLFVAGAHDLWQGDTNWSYMTPPQAALNGRKIAQPRGKLMGGSAAINVGSWSRGTKENYQSWDLPGWDWDTIRDVYLNIERSPRQDTALRGTQGPMRLEDTPQDGVLTEAFRAVALELGIGVTKDRNAKDPTGFDVWETIFPEGRRRNTVDGYLSSARRRKNLTIEPNAYATRLNFDGKRAISVSYQHNGHGFEAAFAKEVILCCGTINTPQLLLLSGVGPAEHLRAHGIEVVESLPGVGQNLSDHLRVDIGALTPKGVGETLYGDASDGGQLQQWRATGYGPLAFNENTSAAFVRSSPDVPHPDIEFMYSVNPPYALRGKNPSRAGWYINTGLIQPKSRGSVHLASADPLDKPVFDPAYLSDPADIEIYVKGVQLALRHASAEAMLPFIDPETLTLPHDSPAELVEDHIRNHAESIYHPVGTAKMGSDEDSTAVLDPQLRLRGLQGVRIADASAIPRLISGHTLAPTILVAEMAAKFIAET